MVFTSHLFLFVFLPLALAAYYAAPRGLKNGVLVLLSYAFYGWSHPAFIAVMLGSTVVDYLCGLRLSEPRRGARHLVLAFSIATNLGALGFFKYAGFGVENARALLSALGLAPADWEPALRVTLPLGISFYTFQSMSYTIDAYPWAGASGAELRGLCLLRVDVPAARRGPDRALQGDPGAAPRAGPFARRLRPRSHRLPPGLREEGPDRESLRGDRRHRVRRRRAGPRGRLARARRLHAADLLRLQRLFGHGGGARADAGLRAAAQLHAPVPRAVDHGLLAPLAPFALGLAARLPLRPAGREPPRPEAYLRQPDARHAPRRAVARGVVESRCMGGDPRRPPGPRTNGGVDPRCASPASSPMPTCSWR